MYKKVSRDSVYRAVREQQHGSRRQRTLPSTTARPGIDFRQLRLQVRFQDVLQRLGYWQSMKGSQPQLRGPCPLHAQPHEPYRCFSVNTHHNIYRCFHCECGSAGNVLDFWAAVHRLPVYEAAINLAQTFDIDVTTLLAEKQHRYDAAVAIRQANNESAAHIETERSPAENRAPDLAPNERRVANSTPETCHFGQPVSIRPDTTSEQIEKRNP